MPIPLVADRAYVRAIRSQMLYPLSYGRTVSSQVHAQIEHLIRCHDSERRPTQYTASI